MSLITGFIIGIVFGAYLYKMCGRQIEAFFSALKKAQQDMKAKSAAVNARLKAVDKKMDDMEKVLEKATKNI